MRRRTISIKRARQLLGKQASDLDDGQVEALIGSLEMLAEAVIVANKVPKNG